MIGDRAREFITNTRLLTNPTRILVNINPQLLVAGETPETNPNLVYTTGLYSLTYRRLTHTGALNKKRFCLRFDFGKGFVKFDSLKELREQAKSNDHVRFLLEYTNLQSYMLAIALLNESMQIPVCFDMCKYDKKVRNDLGEKDTNKYLMLYNPYRPTYEHDIDEAVRIFTGGKTE